MFGSGWLSICTSVITTTLEPLSLSQKLGCMQMDGQTDKLIISPASWSTTKCWCIIPDPEWSILIMARKEQVLHRKILFSCTELIRILSDNPNLIKMGDIHDVGPSIVYEQWLGIDHANMSKAGPINRDTHLDYPRKDDLNLRGTNVSWMPEWLCRNLPQWWTVTLLIQH